MYEGPKKSTDNGETAIKFSEISKECCPLNSKTSTGENEIKVHPINRI